MPLNSIKGKATIAIILVIIVLATGSWLQSKEKPPEDKSLDVSFSEEDLGKLGKALENLEFEDLEGLVNENVSVLSFSEEDLNNLGNALNGLEFEDLAGLIDS